MIIGIPQQCNQGAWSSICNDGTNTNNLAELICRVAGFTGESFLKRHDVMWHYI